MQEVAICPECKKDGDGTIVKAYVYPALLPHSPASASAVTYVIFEKTFMGMPYYRQESGMAELGLKLPRETMANWYIYCAEHYFYPIYERMHAHLIRRDILHADETTCQVLCEEGKCAESTSYMWIFLTGSDGLPPIILYDYETGRGGAYARDERKVKREEKETAVWNGFWKWINSIKALGGSKLEKAVNYALNHQETLCNYMKDGRCEISNNAAERRAKSYAIGRKAFLFHTSVAGANASAVMYSMIETAKANNLNVFQYLYMVLLYMPDYKNEPEGIEQLLPWSDFMKEHCTCLIDVENITAEKHEPLPI